MRAGDDPLHWQQEFLAESEKTKAPGRRERESAPSNKQTRVEEAFTYIRSRILDFSLKSGVCIGDASTAAELGISRTPVREALRRLELEGLVRNVPHRGWTVRTLQLKDIEEIFELKESLESMLVRQATSRLTAEAKAMLIKAISTMEDAAKAEDREAFLAADDCFHDTLYEAATNERAKQILSSINAQWRWVRLGLNALRTPMNQAAQEHRAILDRVLASDAVGAAARTTESISRVKRFLLDLLNNLALPFATTMERH
jgi:DNA-binding GntR family transcriptional regulator